MKKTRHGVRWSLSVAALLALGGILSGCGSELASDYGDVSVSMSGGDGAVNAGNAVTVQGIATTPTTKLQTIEWSVSTPAGASAAVVSNEDCSTATKSTTVVDSTSTNSPATGASAWSCPLSITAPTSIKTDTSYTVTFTATDERGTVKSVTRTVKFLVPASTSSLTATAGTDFSVNAGATAPLHCGASGGAGAVSYQWVIASNGGLPISLDAYDSADANFTAPAVSAPTVVSLTCRATDASNSVATATSNVTVLPVAVTTNALVARIVNTAVLSPGDVVQLNSTGTGWYGSDGASTTGPVPTYAWSTTAAGVTLSDPSSPSPTLIIPSGISSTLQIPVTLKVTSGTSSSTVTSVYTVDPYGPLQLTITPSAAAGSINTAYAFAATATYAGSARPLYYQWTQISGPTLTEPLGGQTTATLGVAPSLAGQYVFRLAVGYEPITSSAPGAYTADVVLTVQ